MGFWDESGIIPWWSPEWDDPEYDEFYGEPYGRQFIYNGRSYPMKQAERLGLIKKTSEQKHREWLEEGWEELRNG